MRAFFAIGVLLLTAGCTDVPSNPETWTIEEVHIDVPLEGGHQLACADCHGQAALRPLAASCESCHLKLYDEASQPDHRANGYPTQCAECHDSHAWRPSFYDHSVLGFALLGAHRRAVCAACHPQEQPFGELPTDCWSCHETDFASADPDHVALAFDHDCTACHTNEDWRTDVFNHETTEFPLAGKHVTAACRSCHAEGFTGTSTMCEACHIDEFNTTTDPDHLAGEYPTDCATCHDANGWTPSFFDHEALGFRLDGAHQVAACTTCHPRDEPIGKLPTDCFSCHETDLVGADPDHQALGFSQQCQDCHTTTDWMSDAFDHDATQFPLRGRHAEAECAACHADGYAETTTDCAVCHAEDEPRDHFGPDCAACHTDEAWEPSTFDHEPSFPLQQGKHRRYRNDCAACHFEPADYATFTCTDCHDGEHDRLRTDREHDEVRDYRYDSIACYDCHPRGSEDDAEEDDDD